MKKRFLKIVIPFLVLTMLLTAAPLEGFTGIPLPGGAVCKKNTLCFFRKSGRCRSF